jgi:hypothetical protein
MKKSCLLMVTAILTVSCASAVALDSKRSQIGTLSCDVAPSIGFIIGSQQQLTCGFNSRSGLREAYTGTITRLGLDIGFSAGGKLVWGVLARTKDLGARALVGSYVGGSGDISLGMGVGANALVGGSNRTIALQPVSIKGQVGANLALGVAGMALQ